MDQPQGRLVRPDETENIFLADFFIVGRRHLDNLIEGHLATHDIIDDLHRDPQGKAAAEDILLVAMP